ncbi:protein of unknown function [Xenorhabdus poinarii G6]|uniref:Uncharacterized protein n=1 Tax=Xenorhabdus poinarii G6 TaxID=1354304 RepID=A0A068QXU5_9GAMM|nr:protein of unknown function [Xenorhabdus poinarii G6]
MVGINTPIKYWQIGLTVPELRRMVLPGYPDMVSYVNKLTIDINLITKSCWSPLTKKHDFFGWDEIIRLKA